MDFRIPDTAGEAFALYPRNPCTPDRVWPIAYTDGPFIRGPWTLPGVLRDGDDLPALRLWYLETSDGSNITRHAVYFERWIDVQGCALPPAAPRKGPAPMLRPGIPIASSGTIGSASAPQEYSQPAT